MAARVWWMVPADDAILRLLAPPKALELITSEIARNTGYSRAHVRNRVGILADAGMVEKMEDPETLPHYRATKQGERFVEGKIPMRELKEIGEELDLEPDD